MELAMCSENNKNSELVSIVVPVYNVDEYLDECVSSILAQTYKSIELILVDDGSTDRCPEMCDLWSNRDARVRVFHKKNGGLSDARNVGLDAAAGNYILFVDSDDIIASNLVEVCLNRIERDRSDGCFFKHRLFIHDIGDSYPYPESSTFPEDGAYSSAEFLGHILHQRMHNYAQMHLIKASIYRENNFRFPCGRNMEDLATTFLLAKTGVTYSAVNSPLYYYRQREGSLVSLWNHQLTLDTFLALESMIAYVSSHFPEFNEDVLNYAIKFGFYCWMNEPRQDKSNCSLKIRRGKCRSFIKNHIHTLGYKKLSPSNMVKYLALNCGLLGLGNALRNRLK